MQKHTADYKLVGYWTRLSVGVKHAPTNKQVWSKPATVSPTASAFATFRNLILLANEVVARKLRLMSTLSNLFQYISFKKHQVLLNLDLLAANQGLGGLLHWQKS